MSKSIFLFLKVLMKGNLNIIKSVKIKRKLDVTFLSFFHQEMPDDKTKFVSTNLLGKLVKNLLFVENIFS